MSTLGKNKIEYLRNFIFGVEDSLVSTIGLVSGIAVAGVSRGTIILTGVVLIFVEAFSMAVGSLLSENAADEYAGKKEVAFVKDLGYAAVMLASYLLSGFTILLPYMFLPSPLALVWSIIIAVLGLFTLGAWSGKISKVQWFRRGLVMASIGGATIILGIVIGQIIQFYL